MIDNSSQEYKTGCDTLWKGNVKTWVAEKTIAFTVHHTTLWNLVLLFPFLIVCQKCYSQIFGNCTNIHDVFFVC